MLHQAQKFGDTGPYKNFHFLFNPLTVEFFFYLSGMLWDGNVIAE